VCAAADHREEPDVLDARADGADDPRGDVCAALVEEEAAERRHGYHRREKVKHRRAPAPKGAAFGNGADRDWAQ
jgi:hypothetical protein